MKDTVDVMRAVYTEGSGAGLFQETESLTSHDKRQTAALKEMLENRPESGEMITAVTAAPDSGELKLTRVPDGFADGVGFLLEFMPELLLVSGENDAAALVREFSVSCGMRLDIAGFSMLFTWLNGKKSPYRILARCFWAMRTVYWLKESGLAWSMWFPSYFCRKGGSG